MKTNRLVLFLSIVMIGFLTSCEKKCNCDDQNFTPPDGTFCYVDEGRTEEMLDYTEIVAMLRNYDATRIAPLEKALGYEDSRLNTYNFEGFKKYLGHIENLSKKAKIKISGISFISAAKANYDGTKRSYQDLIYIPTTTVNGKQIAFDPVQSLKQGKLVTFKEMLAANGYNWIYNSIEDFKKGKRPDNNYSTQQQQQQQKSTILTGNQKSGAGNWGQLTPPK
ncbi:hypothetical protein LPB136_12530 [Tenacibaculum todarodis]|uniref:Lipoprotein n=1 Tax=Tenacibaculum todarodis TaxID=1850252 RepID=A0A1L3JLW6_9FLAO|nr:hypothetical protein [Tenacibaculum todarodis]APG66145.1 hypothetical protein LPB136_12530 [Tenacibaculum todarodis]